MSNPMTDQDRKDAMAWLESLAQSDMHPPHDKDARHHHQSHAR